MRGTVLYAPGDVRFEERADPTIVEPTDAIIKIAATCVCGSDLWSYRGINEVKQSQAIGHEYCGVVAEIGAGVTSVKVGDFVVGGFFACDNTCPHCRYGAHAGCDSLQWYDGCQSELLRVPLADGTLVATPEQPSEDLLPSLLTLSDVMCTGWHAATSAQVKPGDTVVVVGDGAVGLCGVLSAKIKGAERIIAMSRNPSRQALARDFGATDIVEARGDEGIAAVKELTGGIGADATLECVGTDASVKQALGCARPGSMVGFVGVPHDVNVPLGTMFRPNVGLHGGTAHVRKYLPELMDLVWRREIEPGKVFDLTLPLSEVAEAYQAMDERRAIKAMLIP